MQGDSVKVEIIIKMNLLANKNSVDIEISNLTIYRSLKI